MARRTNDPPPVPKTTNQARVHANRINSNAREILDALRPSTRNSYRPALAAILDATNKLLALADSKQPSADTLKDKV